MVGERERAFIQMFGRLDELEVAVLGLLSRNGDLFKYLMFPDRDPLSHGITAGDIAALCDEESAGCRVFFEPFVESALTTHTAMLRVYPCQLDPVDVYEGDLFLQVDVIVHQGISRIAGGRRRNRILAEVLRSLNGQAVGLAQRLRLLDRPAVLQQFKGDYWGWSVLFKCGAAGDG